MLSQFERLQMKMTQQKELIEQLKKENSTLTELKVTYRYIYVHAHVYMSFSGSLHYTVQSHRTT